MLMLRSCASSTTMTEYFDNKKSMAISRRRTPSVMNLIQVEADTVLS